MLATRNGKNLPREVTINIFANIEDELERDQNVSVLFIPVFSKANPEKACAAGRWTKKFPVAFLDIMQRDAISHHPKCPSFGVTTGSAPIPEIGFIQALRCQLSGTPSAVVNGGTFSSNRSARPWMNGS